MGFCHQLEASGSLRGELAPKVTSLSHPLFPFGPAPKSPPPLWPLLFAMGSYYLIVSCPYSLLSDQNNWVIYLASMLCVLVMKAQCLPHSCLSLLLSSTFKTLPSSLPPHSFIAVILQSRHGWFSLEAFRDGVSFIPTRGGAVFVLFPVPETGRL